MSLIERLRVLDTCALSDALDVLGLCSATTGLRPLWPSATTVAGRARTVLVGERRAVWRRRRGGSRCHRSERWPQVLGLGDFTRDGTLAWYIAAEARNLAPLPADIDFVVTAALPISRLTADQALFVHSHPVSGHTVLIHGAAGGVGSIAVELARAVGARESAPADPTIETQSLALARTTSSTCNPTGWTTPARRT